MSLKDKPYYFLTDRSTWMHYLVDNRSQPNQRHLFYPTAYESRRAGQIQNLQMKMTAKLLLWSMWNKQGMQERDWKVCMSKVIDIGFGLLTTLAMAKFSRMILFRTEFVIIEDFMENFAYDVRFWKAILAYSGSFYLGYTYLKSTLSEIHLFDLALEYQPHFSN